VEIEEPNSFLQNFAINLIMVAIALEIISALIQITRIISDWIKDWNLTKKLKKVTPTFQNIEELINMENDGFATKHVYLTPSQVIDYELNQDLTISRILRTNLPPQREKKKKILDSKKPSGKLSSRSKLRQSQSLRPVQPLASRKASSKLTDKSLQLLRSTPSESKYNSSRK
jgi:hypothetical protein